MAGWIGLWPFDQLFETEEKKKDGRFWHTVLAVVSEFFVWIGGLTVTFLALDKFQRRWPAVAGVGWAVVCILYHWVMLIVAGAGPWGTRCN